jgi:RNA polymerase sigma-70 factor, ECF subfamily
MPLNPDKAAQSYAPLPGELALVQQAQAGDPDAFARLYDAYVERIYRYAYFRVSDGQAAEDITSQVFLKAWERLHSYRVGKAPFIAWLYRIARNLVIDHYRSHKPAVALEEAQPTQPGHADRVDERVDQQAAVHSLTAALGHLTEEQQQVLLLRFVEGLPTDEIARQMGRREGAIRALQMRALQALARQIGV